jgi:hypothetical protein
MAIYIEAPPEVNEDLVEQSDAEVLTTAEAAECTCPDFCERDHEND